MALGLAGLAFVLWRPIQVATAYAHRTAVFLAIRRQRRSSSRRATGGYGVIAVDPTNSGPAERSLVLRIHDATHDMPHEDRFNLPGTIAPRTRATLRVALQAVETAPASRRMYMARIANVMLFGQPPAASGALYVSRMWLE